VKRGDRTFNEEGDWIDNLHRTDPFIAAITPTLIENALKGFALELVTGWDMPRLASAIQDVANLGRVHPSDGPKRVGNADAKKKIQKLAKLASELQSGWRELPEEANRFVFWEAFHCFESLSDLPDIEHFGFSSDDFTQELTTPLARIAEILDMAAWRAGSQTQPKKWKSKEEQLLRIRFAMGLSRHFEAAFGKDATVNNWESATSIGPWADFYQRMREAIFAEQATPNLIYVLKEARKRKLGQSKKV
jgi:hypothetical protein